MTEADARKDLIAACRKMTANGLNQGTSGNVSVRYDDRMLISPSATPYDRMTPDMVASMDLSGDMTGQYEGPKPPSTEWRFHLKLLRERAELNAVVHAHPPYCTALSILRQPIPACHYMIAAFDGIDVRCAEYHTFGTPALADAVVAAMTDRTACLMANHGMLAAGDSLAKAMWRAQELETLARQFHLATQIGQPVLLSEEQIDGALASFAGYGLQAD